jgi:serine/threonine-protein kinase
MATLKAVVGAKVTPPSEVLPGVPKSLDAVVMKALARKRDERFQSAGELQLAIEDFLLAERLPGTQAHLTAFMKDLYASELEEDRFASEPTVIQYDPRLAREQSSASSSKAGPVQGQGQEQRRAQAPAQGGGATPPAPASGTPARTRTGQSTPAAQRPPGSRGTGEKPE